MSLFKWIFPIIFYINISQVFPQNESLADSLLQNINNIKSDTVRINKIINLASNSYLNNYELALIFIDKALEQSLDANYKQGIADAYNLYGIIDLDLSNYESAKENFYKALEIYLLIKDNHGIVNVHNNLGLIFSDLGEYVNSLDNYIKALKILEIENNKNLLALIYSNLGKLYMEIKDKEKAMDYLKKAEVLSLEVNDRNSLIYIYNMMGKLSLDNKDYEKALSYYRIILNDAKTYNNQVMVSSILRNIGDVYLSVNKLDTAFINYNKSLNLAKEINNTVNIIRSLNSIGYYFYYIKEYEISKTNLEECYAKSKKVGFKEGIKNSALHLSYVYKERNNYQLAYQYRIQYDDIYNQMYSNKTFHAISETFKKLQQERLEYNFQLNLQKKKINNLIFILLAVLSLITFSSLYAFQRKIARRAVKKQHSLNKELTSKAIYLVRKNEVFNKIENILNQNKKHFIKENQQTIQDIINEVKLAKNEEVWKEFEVYFNKVHKNFHEKLHEKFPKLSVNEKRLCSLLRANMKTKDISLITQQSPHTIDIARSRLRKKLGISNKKISLHEFLSHF